MKPKFELSQDEIKKIVADHITRETGWHVAAADVRLSISPAANDGPMYSPASVSAVATASEKPRASFSPSNRHDAECAEQER